MTTEIDIEKVSPGEIVYCDITYSYKKMYRKREAVETVKLCNVVFGREYKSSYPYLDYSIYKRNIRKINKKKPLDCDVKIINLKIHARVGFKRKDKTYTEVKKNQETRNKITGAYE